MDVVVFSPWSIMCTFEKLGGQNQLYAGQVKCSRPLGAKTNDPHFVTLYSV